MTTATSERWLASHQWVGRWFIISSLIWLNNVLIDARSGDDDALALYSYVMISLWLWLAFTLQPLLRRRPGWSFVVSLLHLLWAPRIPWWRVLRFW